MKKSTGLMIAALSLSTQAGAQAERSGYEDYLAESEFYIETMQVTRREIRTWRSALLAERFEGKLKTIENDLAQSNQQILKEVERTIKENGIDGLDDVLLMRVSQLQFERENLLLNQRMKLYDSQMKSYFEGQLKEPPAIPAPNYKAAIEFAMQLIKRFPRSPLSDRAHYLMALAYEEMGSGEEARKVYLSFLSRHPFSPLSDEARWRLGEHYFDNGEYAKALVFYSQLANNKVGSFRLKALYKQAATLFAQKQYSQAGTLFYSLYDGASQNIELSRENETLVDEALEYLGIVRGLGFDVPMENKLAEEATRRLARAFQRLPNEERARLVYLDFLSKRPASPQFPFFSDAVIESFLGDGLFDRADSSRDVFVTQLTRDRRWWDQNREARKSYFEAEDLLEKYLLASAQGHAQRGYDQDNKAQLKIARDQYQQFLASFPYSALTSQVRYELAQVEYFNAVYPSARENFLAILNDPGATEWHERAGYGYFLATAKQVGFILNQPANLEVKRGPGGELLPPQKLSERDSAVLAAAGRYMQVAIPGERRQSVMLKTAEIHFQNNSFDAADKASEAVISEEGSGITKARAIRLNAEVANLRGDWKKVAARNSQLNSLSIDATSLQREGLAAAEVSEQNFQNAKNLEARGQANDAAEEYERLAIAFPKSTSSSAAHLKAATLFRQEFRFKSSDQSLEHLKGTRYEDNALFLKASNAQSVLDYGRAAQMFTDFVSRFPKSPMAPQAAYQAASLRRDLRQYPAAVEMMMRYYAYNPSDSIIADAVEIAARGTDVTLAQKLAERTQSRSGEASWRIRAAMGEINWKSGNVKRTGEICRQVQTESSQKKGTTAIVERTLRLCKFFEAASLTRQSANDPKVQELEKNFSQDLDLIARLRLEQARSFQKSGNREEAVKVAKLGFQVLRGNSFSPEGKALYDFLRETGDLPTINLGVLFPWHLADGYQTVWASPSAQQLAWGDVRSLCERELYEECVRGAEKLLETESSDELRLNLAIANLRAGWTFDAKEAFKKYGEKASWSPSAVRLAWLFGFQSLLPLNSKVQLAQESRQKAESLAADARRLFSEGKFKDAIQRINLAIYEDATLQSPYLTSALIFQETGNFELMREALRKGAAVGRTRTALYGMARVIEALTDGVVASDLEETTEQMDTRAIYGQAFAAWWVNKQPTADALQTLLDTKPLWGADLSNLKKLISGTGPMTEGSEKSYRTTYLKAISRREAEGLKASMEHGAPETFWLKDLMRGK